MHLLYNNFDPICNNMRTILLISTSVIFLCLCHMAQAQAKYGTSRYKNNKGNKPFRAISSGRFQTDLK